MKTATLQDLKDNLAAGGSHLHVITQESRFFQHPGLKTQKRIPEFVESLIFRLKGSGDGIALANSISEIPLPYDIWLYEFEREEDAKTFWGKPKKIKTKMTSTYFVFKNKISHEHCICWNMWIMGYFTRPYRE